MFERALYFKYSSSNYIGKAEIRGERLHCGEGVAADFTRSSGVPLAGFKHRWPAVRSLTEKFLPAKSYHSCQSEKKIRVMGHSTKQVSFFLCFSVFPPLSLCFARGWLGVASRGSR